MQDLGIAVAFIVVVDGDDPGGVADGACRKLFLQRLEQHVTLHAPGFVGSPASRSKQINSPKNRASSGLMEMLDGVDISQFSLHPEIQLSHHFTGSRRHDTHPIHSRGEK
jgi:hypothetical protein